jgi:hypothetical protein
MSHKSNCKGIKRFHESMIERVEGSRNEGFKYSRSQGIRKPESQRGGSLEFEKPRVPQLRLK